MAFKTPQQVLQEMLDDHEQITGTRLDPADFSREEVIKFYPIAGAISGMYAALVKSDDDRYPQSASTQGLRKALAARQLPDQIQAQPSDGVIALTATPGSVFLAGKQVKRNLDGKIYVATAGGAVGVGGTIEIPFVSLLSGQDQNIDVVGDEFTLVTPVAGFDAACESTTEFRNGRNLETDGEMLARIEEHDRNDDTGGNLRAYERMAKAASPLVVTAKAIKQPRGGGTVDTVITSGTTDIEAAVYAGDPVSRLPSNALITAVQAYIVENNPTTDDHQTIGPTEQSFNSTLSLGLYDESLRLTVEAEITKIWKVFVYTAVSGEIIFPTDLERRIDQKLGHLIKSRRVSDFGVGVPGLLVPNNKIMAPGTLTINPV
jgi:uncharacterized phage protein gp47/JayE